jgi:hypothetical protein
LAGALDRLAAALADRYAIERFLQEIATTATEYIRDKIEN